jgi:hypothetical protein
MRRAEERRTRDRTEQARRRRKEKEKKQKEPLSEVSTLLLRRRD